MQKKEKDSAIQILKDKIAAATKLVHELSKKRKEAVALIREKDKNLDYCFSKDVSRLREEERKKRLQLYGTVEDQRQRVTSMLIMELKNICREDEVPRYVFAIGKILDNFQGSSGTLCSRSCGIIFPVFPFPGR